MVSGYSTRHKSPKYLHNKHNTLLPTAQKPNLKQKIVLSRLTPEMWTAELDGALDRFAADVTQETLCVYFDPLSGLHVEPNMPSQNVEQLIYFIRKDRVALTPENLDETLQFGSIRGSYIVTLLRLMNGIYAPYIFSDNSWPESIRNNFLAHVHRFLAALTDTRYKLQGHTVLYIPIEAMHLKSEEAVNDKELVQRLETAMVHWTRQIKEVLGAQEVVEMRESSGPLEEIEFWRDRCADLSGISTQLDKPGVKHIELILQLAKSSYIGPFQKLSKQIQEGSIQAQSNLSFLTLLKQPFQEMVSLKIKEIPNKLPRLLDLVRIIWVNSPYYNTRERLTSLFRKISNEIIRLCSREISLDRIFDGFITSSRKVLQDCIECCTTWKEQYTRAAQTHHRFSKVGWVLDQTSIFAQVDAFIQRCRDLLEVCLCQQQFGRWEDGQQTPLPCFPGQRGPQTTRNLLEIEETFHKNLAILKSVKKTILDVKNTSWHDDYNR
ncbi:unnamed protein product [Ranitomeya imitator]|uniref:Dynein heavy chain tail domain-containing protein n=1 Tax=Ranitomeya imitator TaxID=111125 RepID=A0ABN9MG55_9NEOB|nr:unnamed protein product [Ranitomeya imitator]